MEMCSNCGKVELTDDVLCASPKCDVKDHCKDCCPNKDVEGTAEEV